MSPRTRTIDGTGRIDLNLDDSNTDFNDAQFRTVEGAVARLGAAHTVSGKGRMNGAWLNDGTISADRPGQDLQLLGVIDQSGGGQIRADDGFAVLFGVDVSGGSFDSSGAGAVLAQGAAGSISGVTNQGEAGLRNGAALSLDAGGMTNNGTFTVNSSQESTGPSSASARTRCSTARAMSCLTSPTGTPTSATPGS
jgi:hypothetical protein